jgi:hypothetical protein
MKSAFIFACLLALFASTATAQEQTDSFPYTDASNSAEDGPSESLDYMMEERPCTMSEGGTAGNHCRQYHAGPAGWMGCYVTSCVVRGGWIVYSWNGYYKFTSE